METYYVKTDVPEFTEKMVQALKERGLKEKKSLPVDFLFLSGEASYYRNKVDTKQSKYFSKLWGKSIEDLTNKVILHKKYGDKDFLIDSEFLTQSSELPKLSGHTLKILKPLGGFEGHGITIVNKTSQIQEWLKQHTEYDEWLLQNYIRNPALKDGYKFHLRVLTLVKKDQRKPIEVYVATHKFYVKAEEQYEKGDWLNPRIHDTHYKPGKMETFPQSLPDGWTEKEGEKIDEKINLIVRDLLEKEDTFKPDWNAKNGFEVFGVDILFDKKKPYMLEFNHKMSLKGRYSYAPGIVQLIVDGVAEPYFVRVL
jgi:hypothetical protein